MEDNNTINSDDFNPPAEVFRGASNALRSEYSGNPWGRNAKKLRELWEIGSFGVGFSFFKKLPVTVRESNEEPADGQMKLSDIIVDLQTTVRNREGRTPNKEWSDRVNDTGEARLLSPEATGGSRVGPD